MKKPIVLPRVNRARINQFAALVKTASIEKPLNFYSFPGKDGVEIIAKDDYPPLHAPWVIDFFFFACIHQYGFWQSSERYEEPLYGTLNGKQVKGSELLWKLLLKAFAADPSSMNAAKLATMTRERWESIMSDDNGIVELLAGYERLLLTHAYGNWFIIPRMMESSGPTELISYAKTYPNPLDVLRAIITDNTYGIPGYHEDPLKKKAVLLLMALTNRPEQFIIPEESFVWDPIVDYHLMRLALRLGLVVLPPDWLSENSERQFTSIERERAIRKAVFRAVGSVIKQSGRSMAEIDNLMWSAQCYCPEMEAPNCGACMLQSACAQKTELFQPVLRTTAY